MKKYICSLRKDTKFSIKINVCDLNCNSSCYLSLIIWLLQILIQKIIAESSVKSYDQESIVTIDFIYY